MLARVGFKLGQLAGGGEAEASALRDSLCEIARQWPNVPKSLDTLRRTFDAGMEHPRVAPPSPFAQLQLVNQRWRYE